MQNPVEKQKLAPRREACCRSACIVTASIMLCLGLSVMAGWVFQIEALIRYAPNTRAMVFNSALCFTLFAIAIFLKMYSRIVLSNVFILFVFVIAFITFAEHVTLYSANIDHIFIQHYDTILNPYPGRMTLNGTIFLMLGCIAMWLLSIKTQHKYLLLISMIFSVIIFTMAAVFLAGYVNAIIFAYSGVHSSSITPGALGFLLLSINLMLQIGYCNSSKNFDLITYTPLLIVVCIFTATSRLSYKMYEQESINNLQSELPYIAFAGGVIVAIMFGVLLYFAISAFRNYKNSQHALSVMHAVLDSAADGIVVTDLEGNVVACNKLFFKILDVKSPETISWNRRYLTKLILSMVANKHEYFVKRKIFAQDMHYDGIDEVRFKNGNIYERHIKPHVLDGMLIGRVVTFRDITLQRRLEQQLMSQSTHDSLTNLPNRALIFDLIGRAIASAETSYNKIALFLIDIDKFSVFNDSFGRTHGDELLKMIAGRLKKLISVDVVLGRIGGDEFIILHSNIKKPEVAVLMVNKIVSAFNEQFELYGNLIHVTACVGVSLHPYDGQDTDTLLSNASVALTRAKSEGRNAFAFFTEGMNKPTISHVIMQAQLHTAITKEQFLVHYQPIFDLNTNKPVGVEALVRWKNEEGQIVQPLDFIPLAEEVGLINSIGDLVIIEVCKQIRRWNDSGIKNLNVAVNVSAPQLKNKNFLNSVIEATTTNGVNPSQLEIELTESVFINRVAVVDHNLQGLANIGIGIAVDDFGTGYSSFSYVKKFCISKIKIDQTFVVDALHSHEDRAIVSAMIAMGKNLGFTVLAEGIETKANLELMKQMGCNQGQGFYLALPMTAEECTAFLKSRLQ